MPMNQDSELAREFLRLKEMCGWDFETAEECLDRRQYSFMLAAFAWVSMKQDALHDSVERHKTAHGHFDPFAVAKELLDLYLRDNPIVQVGG